MRNIDVNLSLELAKEVFREFFLVELYFSTPRYFTDLDFTLYAEGKTFLPRGVKLPNMNYALAMSVDRATVQLDDVDQQIIAALLQADQRGRVAVIKMGALDAGYNVIGLAEVYRGFVDSWEKTESQVSITLANEFIMWRKQSLRTASATCPWVFKGLECTYAGAASSCDQSWEDCGSKGNTDHFGGDRFIPSLTGTNIWWGKTAKL